MAGTSPSRDRARSVRGGLAALAGAVIGFALASMIYLTVNPVLEASSSPWREMQGLLWNLVPLLTAVGCLLGWRVGTRRH
jgi:cell division protein FtsX